MVGNEIGISRQVETLILYCPAVAFDVPSSQFIILGFCRKKDKNLFTYLGSKGNKIFLKKWGLSINFFEKHYLKSGLDGKKQLIFNEYKGSLSEPIRNLKFYYITESQIKLKKKV